MITCETVTVRITDEAGNVINRVVPAYTRSRKEMEEEIGALVAEYLDLSVSADAPMSLGDFALFAVAEAADDPRKMRA